VKREDFCALPLPIALGVLFDIAHKLADVPMPDIPRSPKYDGRLSRGSKGYCWMSEMDLESLQWWHAKTTESASRGGQYAEKDAKTAATLGKWIAWRTVAPDATWRGTRGDTAATGQPPSREPQLHQWEERPPDARATTSTAPRTEPDDDC
jgi:hypothetical protein